MEDKKIVLAAALFVSSVLVLGIKLLNPTQIQIFVEGSSAAVSRIPGVFTLGDVAIIVASSIALSASGIYLLFFSGPEKPAGLAGKAATGRMMLEERKGRWEDVSKTLKDDEQKAYKAIIDSEGVVNQSELAGKTGLPKSSVSRALDLLESKGLVERKRRGMGNVVLLK